MLKLIVNNLQKKITLYKEWKEQSKNVKNWFILYLQSSSLVLDIVSKVFRRVLFIKDITIRVCFNNGLTMHFPYDRANELTKFIYIYDSYMNKFEQNFPGKMNLIKGTVLDFGAHVGTFGIVGAWNNPGWNVELFEASPDNFSVLMKTLTENHQLSVNLSARPLAVGSESGLKTFKKGRTSTIGSLESSGFRNSSAQHGLIKVTSKNINEILDGHREISLIKCDVEGGEYDIFSAISEENWIKIQSVIIEAHPTENHQPDSIIELLTSRGFNLVTDKHKNLCVDIYAVSSCLKI